MKDDYPEYTVERELEEVRRWSQLFCEENHRAPRYHIRTFGCQQNDHDSEIAAGILEEMGFAGTPLTDHAELILFNTCSVRASADDRFFGHVGRLKPLKKGRFPLVGVFGCMMEQAIHRDTIARTFPYVDFVLGAGAMELLPETLSHLLFSPSPGKTVDLSGKDSDPFARGLPVRRIRPHRALITIMTGCNNFCSYCIVPYTRGREKSRPFEQILEEARGAVRSGAVEIMLLGQNVNSYGNDIRRRGGEAVSFADLLCEVGRIDSLGIVRYMTSHPKDLSDDLIAVIGAHPVIEPHIHLPIQSGSDRILQQMNRRYSAAHFMERVRKLRASRPGITITTDLIVGFPGETEKDFEETLQVMEELRFDAAFTFIYSPRTGTPAASRYQVSAHPLVQERFERLVQLQNRISLESNSALVGLTVDVLADGPSRRNPRILSGRTRDDRLVNFSVDDMTSLQGKEGCRDLPPAGSFIPVRIERAGSFSLEGRASII
ncbi:MAG: tRNA (N6-isopentenyl adenosine(37)-C2)-methylthiotransferase MiaB [Clostridiaceae bacterium]|nr:tRNA (N6-isopentenyl adenosine(37)-C2)-methylthiotransferase MiaB [Clostridiaceae bacterium]